MFGINISGWWVSDFGVLEELLQSFDENLELLGMLLSNKHVPIDVLIGLYRRGIPERRNSQSLTGNHFRGLTDEHWLKAIACTTSNPILSNSIYREHELSGLHDELDHPLSRCEVCKMFEAAWNLFGFAPVNDVSSGVLSRFADTLAPYGDGRITSGTSSLEVIKRWEKNESDDEFGNFRKCRVALGRLLEEDKLKDSTDVALRQAYYLNRYWEKPEEVREAFEKDNDEFLDVAVENQSLYVKEDIRCELRECCLRYHSPEDVHPVFILSVLIRCLNRLNGNIPNGSLNLAKIPPFTKLAI